MHLKLYIFTFSIALCFTNLYGQDQVDLRNLDNQIKPPSKFTKAYNKNYADSLRLDWKNTEDFKTSARGLIAAPTDSVILSSEGKTVWNFNTFKFASNLDPADIAPKSINPSLWRMARLNTQAGLYEVKKDSIYQIRGYDLAVMSFVIGDNGYIVIDPLTCPETAEAGHELFIENILNNYNEESPRRILRAILVTHSHIDHFGGVSGIQAAYPGENIDIYAPSGFMEASVSENVYAGNAMKRRASYMYGNILSKDTLSGIGAGLGKGVASGTPGLKNPTFTIDSTGTFIKNLSDSGLDLEFVYAPNTEAPAEMMFYFPDYKALCAAEDATHTLHNLYTLRGAKTRSAKDWVAALTTVLQRWGENVDVEFNSHHWPIWGNDEVRNHLETQRAMYKFIHDQTLHYLNKGYDMTTTAEILTNLPESLNKVWSSQGYYGTVNHDVKGTWDLYMGWFDGNPSNLHKLPAVWPDATGSSSLYVNYMGGAQSILEKALLDYKKGHYRWVAEVVQHVVNNDPSNRKAKQLLADALEQMGYQAVSAPWRNFYLTGAKELRQLRNPTEPRGGGFPIDFLKAMTLDMKFDMLATMVDAHKAEGMVMDFELVIIEDGKEETSTSNNTTTVNTSIAKSTKTTTAFQLKYSCLNYLVGKGNIAFTLTIRKGDLDKALAAQDPGKALAEMAFQSSEKRITITPESGKEKFRELLGIFDWKSSWFNIVTPNLPIPNPINPMKVNQK